MKSTPRLLSLNYFWTHSSGKQANLPAPTYIDYVMTSIQNLVDDENVFPTKSSTYTYFPLPPFDDIYCPG